MAVTPTDVESGAEANRAVSNGEPRPAGRAGPASGPTAARRLALAAFLPLAFLLFWAAAVRYRWITEDIVPSPQQVVQSWYVWIVGTTGFTLSPYAGTWLDTVLFSGRRVLQGFALAAPVGIPLGRRRSSAPRSTPPVADSLRPRAARVSATP